MVERESAEAQSSELVSDTPYIGYSVHLAAH